MLFNDVQDKKKVVLHCLNMKGNKLKKSKSCVCETKQIRQIDRPSKVSKCAWLYNTMHPLLHHIVIKMPFVWSR